MTVADSADLAVRRQRRRFWILLAAFVLLVILIVVGSQVFLAVQPDWFLQRVLQETDRQDPGWRLDDLEAARINPPPDQHSALQVLAAERLLPPKWGGSPEFYELFQDLSPEVRLSKAQLAALKAELAKASDALTEARKLAGNPLRLASQPDGLIIYTVGRDKVDNGGTINRRDLLATGTDLGFRLWDINKRRAPPMKEQ